LLVFFNQIILALRIKYKEKKDVFTEESIVVKEPFNLFKKWIDEAISTPEIIEPNAMCLSTATKEGVPSSR
jgi:pyridoxamine 5'-phosphate oxidase